MTEEEGTAINIDMGRVMLQRMRSWEEGNIVGRQQKRIYFGTVFNQFVALVSLILMRPEIW